MTARIRDASQPVRVHIRRLSLGGFALDAPQARAVGAAAEQELGELLAAGPLPDRLRQRGSVRRSPGGAAQAAAWSDPGDLGRQVAHAVYEGLRR